MGVWRWAAFGMGLGICFKNRWVFPAWYGAEERRARYIHHRPMFEAVKAAYGRFYDEGTRAVPQADGAGESDGI